VALPREHAKANDELKSLVAGRDLMMPTELKKEHQKTWDELSKLSMQKFDKAYVDATVDDHKKDVKLFEKEARSGDDITLERGHGRAALERSCASSDRGVDLLLRHFDLKEISLLPTSLKESPGPSQHPRRSTRSSRGLIRASWPLMVLLTALFSALSRKTGAFIEALFGWSVAALFGRLDPRQRVLVTVALVLSLFWPVFVLGAFLPSVASYLIAFVPLDDTVVRRVLRITWLVLAVVAPVIVGLLVRAGTFAARRRPLLSSILNGYPLALGMALSFLVTLITVPLIKLNSVWRRWADEHVYLQPREGRYRDVLKHLVTACQAAGFDPRVERVPRVLSLSTRLLRVFSRGAVEALLVAEPRRVCCEGLELYLYPADLLLRGEPQRVAAVRARLTATLLERDAYLVRDAAAQGLQDELGRLWDVLQHHQHPGQAVPGLEARFKAIVRESFSAKSIPFDDWLTLDRITRRFESALVGHVSLVDTLAGEVLVAARSAPALAQLPDGPRQLGVVTLVTSLAREARELVKQEAQLAKQEAQQTIAATTRSALVLGVAISCGGATLSLLAMSLVLRFDATVVAALVIAGALLCVTLGLAIVAWGGLPHSPMERTRKRLEDEWKQLSERAS
jgi:hypothetical protein